MAVFNLENYLAKDGFGMSLNIRRGNPNPLDNSSVWSSLSAAQNYAQTDPVAYVGQILTVVEDVVVGEETIKTATAYVIDNEAGDLKEVGSSPVGDEKTITVSEDGTVSLFGISGLALTREEEDGTVTKINYQPLLVDGKLTWVEPSATTVEGLATEIEGLKTRISAVETKIGEVAEGKTITEMISDATYDDTALSNRVGTNEVNIKANSDAITVLNGDGTVEGSVDKKITDAINDFATKVTDGETIDTFKELVDYVGTHGGEAAEMASAIDILETKVGEKSVAVQIEEAIAEENLAQYATDEELGAVSDRVDILEDKAHQHSNGTVLDGITSEKVAAWDIAEKNIINSIDETQFNIDVDRKLTLLDIAMGKVTGLQDALDGKANKGTTLAEYGITDAYTKAETLDKITEKITEINGGESAGEVLGQLNSYKETNDARVDTIEGKLSGIAEGAQANILEAIKINGVAQTITDKEVNIPMATGTLLGVVMGSTAENKISVAEDGTMSVNSVNVNKLVQTDGEYLIMNGGSASI